MATYSFEGRGGLAPGELFFWIVVDTTLEGLGIDDVAAVIAIIAGQPILPSRGKFAGSTPGTSPLSTFLSRRLDVHLPFRLPTLTGRSLASLRVSFTNNLGRFAGRTIPFVGWAYLAYDVTRIIWRSVSRYNAMVQPQDRLF